MMRLCYNVCVLVSFVAFPFVFTALFLALGLLLFPRYAEAVVFGVAIDLLFGAPAGGFAVVSGVGAIMLVGLGIAEVIRTKIRPAGRGRFARG